jgi:hypothetical protein
MSHLFLLGSDAQALLVYEDFERLRAVAGPGFVVSGMGA